MSGSSEKHAAAALMVLALLAGAGATAHAASNGAMTAHGGLEQSHAGWRSSKPVGAALSTTTVGYIAQWLSFDAGLLVRAAVAALDVGIVGLLLQETQPEYLVDDGHAEMHRPLRKTDRQARRRASLSCRWRRGANNARSTRRAPPCRTTMLTAAYAAFRRRGAWHRRTGHSRGSIAAACRDRAAMTAGRRCSSTVQCPVLDRGDRPLRDQPGDRRSPRL